MANTAGFGRVVIIAGSSTGLGRAVAIELASRRGYSLSLCARRKEKLDETKELCVQAGISPSKVLCVYADLGKTDNCKMLVDMTVKTFGGVYGFVTMVGQHFYPENVTDDRIMERFDKTLAVNVASPIYMVHLLVPHLERSKGVVVNASDVLAVYPAFDFVASTVDRAMIDYMTRALAHNLGHKEIRFYSIDIGLVRTDILSECLPKMSKEDRDASYLSSEAQQALPHKGTPEDIAKSIAFFLSDDACFITGVNLRVDAGYTLPFMGNSVTLTCAGD